MSFGYLQVRKTVAVLAFGIFAMAGAANAGDDPEVDCDNPMTQMEMNICSYQDFLEADKELNAVYKQVRARMREWDAELSDDLKGAEKELLKGQRAWIDYRDGTCAVAGFAARGGSMEALLINACDADLTRKRTQELKDLMVGER